MTTEQITVKDSRDAWPFPAVTEASREPNTWVAIREEDADYFLECVPPAGYVRGGFMVGEAARHTAEGYPVYTTILRLRVPGNLIIARDLTRAEANQAYDRVTEALAAGKVEI